jgi:hypothetical protein
LQALDQFVKGGKALLPPVQIEDGYMAASGKMLELLPLGGVI